MSKQATPKAEICEHGCWIDEGCGQCTRYFYDRAGAVRELVEAAREVIEYSGITEDGEWHVAASLPDRAGERRFLRFTRALAKVKP